MPYAALEMFLRLPAETLSGDQAERTPVIPA